MHPIFKSGSTVLAYLAAWIPLGLMFVFIATAGTPVRWIEAVVTIVPVLLALSLVCLFPWYFCKSLPLGSAPIWRIAILHVIPGMFFSGVLIAMLHMIVVTLNRVFPDFEMRFRGVFPVLGMMFCLSYLLSTALHYVLLAVERSQKAETLSREAQLRALKAQVNPHFLFNSLNSISALTVVSPPKAREMCVRLSDFLRNSLRLGERASIPFEEELSLTRTYLDVERIRFGERLRVQQAIDARCGNCDVPPLVIQPLIENAIKHGIATLIEGGEISIAARRDKDIMTVTIENEFDPDAPVQSKSGFGLVNVRNRLHTRFGPGAHVDIQVEKNRYRVTVSIPCDGKPAVRT